MSNIYSGTLVRELTLFYSSGHNGCAHVCVEKMTVVCLSSHAEFVNGSKIVLNASGCEPNCSQTETFVDLRYMKKCSMFVTI